MTYNPNFPTASTPIPNFQQILTNWSQLNTQFGTDHAPLTEPQASNQGHHKLVRLYDVAADPTLSSPQSQVYSKPVTFGADTFRSLFFAQKPNTAAQIIRQLTDLSYTAGAVVSAATTLNFRVYDTPWGWRITTGQTAPFAGSRTFNGVSPGTLGAILYAGATGSGGGPVSTSISPNSPGATDINVQASNSISVYILIISTAL